MEHQCGALHKTFHYKLGPTPAQERALEIVLSRCRTRYNTALEQRKTWWERGPGKRSSYYQQKDELPELKAARPELTEVNAQGLQDALPRVERAYQAFFRRVEAGETPGYPRFQGQGRYHPFTYPQMGDHGGAQLDNGYLVLSKIGWLAVRWSRPLAGIPKRVSI